MSLLIPFLIKHSTKNENGSLNREIWVKCCTLIKEAIQLDKKESVVSQALELEGFKRPDLLDLFIKIDHELYKAFQLSSNLNLDYIERLNDEHKLLLLGEEIQGYIESNVKSNTKEFKSTLALIFLQHLHFKHDSLHEKIMKTV